MQLVTHRSQLRTLSECRNLIEMGLENVINPWIDGRIAEARTPELIAALDRLWEAADRVGAQARWDLAALEVENGAQA